MTFDEWFSHNVETKTFDNTPETRYIAEAAFGAGMKDTVLKDPEIKSLQDMLIEANIRNMDNLDTIKELKKENMKLRQKCLEESYKTRGWHYTKDKDFPKAEDRYLTWRDLHGEQYPQILAFDGKYWVTGNDHPDCMVVAWKEVAPPEYV